MHEQRTISDKPHESNGPGSKDLSVANLSSVTWITEFVFCSHYSKRKENALCPFIFSCLPHSLSGQQQQHSQILQQYITVKTRDQFKLLESHDTKTIQQPVIDPENNINILILTESQHARITYDNLSPHVTSLYLQIEK